MIDLAENIEKLSLTTLANRRAVTVLSLAMTDGPRRLALRAHLDRIDQEMENR